MAELLLNKSTHRQVKTILKSPPHALMICGPAGSGKTALADMLSAELLGTAADKLSGQPYFSRIQKPADKQEIPIEAIREVIKQLKLKPVIGNQAVKRVVLIEDAHLMSAEAQNALLKAIEEPPPATMFILSCLSETAVLPTIASRTQKLKLGPVSLDDAKNYFGKDYDLKSIDSAWSLSGGSAGLMSALLSQDSQHQLKSAVEEAKQLLRLERYERLLYLDKLTSDKRHLADILEALARILAVLHRSAINSGNHKVAKRLIIARQQVDKALLGLEVNASPRLIITNLALSLTV